jgi:hypothetical protein
MRRCYLEARCELISAKVDLPYRLNIVIHCSFLSHLLLLIVTITNSVGSEVLVLVIMKSAVFWVVTLRS